jgi:hypothetical protein
LTPKAFGVDKIANSFTCHPCRAWFKTCPLNQPERRNFYDGQTN